MPKYFLAGTGEKMQYLVHEFNDNTIRFVLKYPGLLSAEALCRAAGMLAGSVDVLHASFQPGNLGALWHVNSEYGESSYFEHVMVADDPAEEAIRLSVNPVDSSAKTQLRCTLVQGENECAVVLALSHLCVDGSDGKYLLMKLAEAYELAVQGSQEKLQVKNGSRATEQVYRGLDAKEYLSLFKDPRTGVKSEFPYPSQEEGQPRAVWQTIPAEQMAAARTRAKRLGASVNDLILAACYHAYAGVEGVDAHAPMSIMSMMDLRRHCKNSESEGLSNLSGSLPTLLREGIGASFEETLNIIAAQTEMAKEDPLAGLQGMPLLHGAARRLPLGLLVAVAGRLYGSMAVGLTNLGNLSGETLLMGGLRPVRGWFGGPLKKKNGMQVSVASFDGECALCIYGCYTETDAQVLQQMLDRMAQIVCDYAMGHA